MVPYLQWKKCLMHSEHCHPNSKEEKNVFHTLQIPFSSWVFVSETQKIKFSNLQTLYLTDQSWCASISRWPKITVHTANLIKRFTKNVFGTLQNSVSWAYWVLADQRKELRGLQL